MKRFIQCADIVKVPADAMIYSTNMRLTLTGGVGAALLREFGIGVQIALQSQSPASGRQQAEVGDVLQVPVATGRWKRVFHTIATDELYCTKASTVQSILRRCLQQCVDAKDVRTITCSALGCGYGDLDIVEFSPSLMRCAIYLTNTHWIASRSLCSTTRSISCFHGEP